MTSAAAVGTVGGTRVMGYGWWYTGTGTAPGTVHWPCTTVSGLITTVFGLITPVFGLITVYLAVFSRITVYLAVFSRITVFYRVLPCMTMTGGPNLKFLMIFVNFMNFR